MNTQDEMELQELMEPVTQEVDYAPVAGPVSKVPFAPPPRNPFAPPTRPALPVTPSAVQAIERLTQRKSEENSVAVTKPAQTPATEQQVMTMAMLREASIQAFEALDTSKGPFPIGVGSVVELAVADFKDNGVPTMHRFEPGYGESYSEFRLRVEGIIGHRATITHVSIATVALDKGVPENYAKNLIPWLSSGRLECRINAALFAIPKIGEQVHFGVVMRESKNGKKRPVFVVIE